MTEPRDPKTVLKWTGDDSGSGGIVGVPAADLTDYDIRALVARDMRWNADGRPLHRAAVREEEIEEELPGGVKRTIRRTVTAFEPLSDSELKQAYKTFKAEVLNSGKYSAVTRQDAAEEPSDAEDSKAPVPEEKR